MSAFCLAVGFLAKNVSFFGFLFLELGDYLVLRGFRDFCPSRGVSHCYYVVSWVLYVYIYIYIYIYIYN